MYTEPSKLPVTVPSLVAMKTAQRPIVALTAYDVTQAMAVDNVSVDVVLVGDSLGMVVQGHASTLPVTVADIAYHTACVARGLKRALLIADMPFMSAANRERAYVAAQAFMQAGAAMVKIEGAGVLLDSIQALSERDVPVCAHLGLTPQSFNKLGGYKVQGRDERAATKLMEDALAVEKAGADLLVLECVPSQLASKITKSLRIPTIGIGAGLECDGQILVFYDALGMTPGKRPRFVKDFMAGATSVNDALARYVEAVRARTFPSAEHGYTT
jgi:3-methyl-2-oxobutanoate hydroxymethyltransferase